MIGPASAFDEDNPYNQYHGSAAVSARNTISPRDHTDIRILKPEANRITIEHVSEKPSLRQYEADAESVEKIDSSQPNLS